MAREPFPVYSPTSRGGSSSWFTRAIEGGAALVLVVYAAVGTVLLAMDHDVVSGCHPSDPHAHIIWHTDIWVYILVSIVVACVFALWLVSLAVFKPPGAPEDSPPLCGLARRLLWGDSLVWDDSEPLDWRLMWGGLTLSGVSILLAILAFWGYVEVYVANPWCDNKAVVWHELELVRFGHATFWLQFVCAVLFFTAGWTCWFLPFALEAKRLMTEDGAGNGTYGSNRGTRLQLGGAGVRVKR